MIIKRLFVYILTAGFLASIVTFVYLVILVEKNIPLQSKARQLDIVFALLAIPITIFLYRKNQVSQELHFWEGLLLGFFVAWSAATFYGLFLTLYFDNFKPTVYSEYLLYCQDVLKNSKPELLKMKVTEKDFEKMMIGLNSTKTLIKDQVFKTLLFSFPVTILFSLLFRKKPYSIYKP